MIDDAERDAMMEVVIGLFQNLAQVRRRSVATTEDGHEESWQIIATVPCMVITKPTMAIVESSNMAVDVNVLRVLVERSVDVRPGDRLTIGDRDFLVVDTTVEAGHRLYQALSCKAIE